MALSLAGVAALRLMRLVLTALLARSFSPTQPLHFRLVDFCAEGRVGKDRKRQCPGRQDETKSGNMIFHELSSDVLILVG